MKYGILFLMLIVVGSFSLVQAETFGYGRTEDIPINYSLIPTVNNSQYLQGYTPTTLKDWIQTLYDSIYSPISEPLSLHLNGDNSPTATINWGGQDLINVGLINASNFNGAWNGSSNYALVGEPLWTTNLTAHNSSWSSTYNSTYDAKYENKDSVNFTSLNISDVTISDYIQDILSDEAIVGCGLSFQQGDLKWSNNSVETDCWKVANGSVGTTDLRQQQLLSASALYSQGDSGGSYQGLGTHSHGNTLYGMGVQNNGAGQFNAGGMYAAGTIVQVTGNSHSASSPPYYTEILKQCMCEGLI